MSQHHPDHRAAKRKGLFSRETLDLPLGAHIALASLAVLLVASTFSDFGTYELLATAYFAAVIYGAMNLCHGYLRDHAPAEPRAARPLPLLAFTATTMVLTVLLRHVTGSNPLALTPTSTTIATGLFLLFFAAFVDPVTNRSLLKRGRDPKRPYAGLPSWLPTWRAATLPTLVLIGIAHVGNVAQLSAGAVLGTMFLFAFAHLGTLVAASRRESSRR